MKTIASFIKSVLIGGVLVILPLGILVGITAKVLFMLRDGVEPLVHELPTQLHFPAIIAALLLVLACFLVGLIARTSVGKYTGNLVERKLLNRIPGYTMVRSFIRRVENVEDSNAFAPAFAEVEDSLVPAFVVEEHADGRFTVFVPSAPTPGIGAIYIMTKDRVHLLDVPFLKTVTCITNWGVGSAELLKKIRVPKQLSA